jgi:DNA-binding SARP family transcriptional activator
MLNLRLLGHFQVADGTVTLTSRLRPRAQRLLAYLLLHRHAPLPRERAAFTLWPDQPEKESLGTLRRALSDLRAALPKLESHEWIIATRDELRWDPDAACWLDVAEFERLVHEATPVALHEAVALYAGDLVSDWVEEWAQVERARLSQMHSGALVQLIGHHRALGDYGAALGLARQALSLDPLSESIHREAIALHYLAGDRGAALAEYERFRARLNEELGVEPMAETQALAAVIARGAPLPVPNVAAPRTSSPAPALPQLIGRDHELAQLIEWWESAAKGRGRFAIVSGEAGVGKSHLTLKLADEVARRGGLALVGHCYEFERALPHQAIIEMLRAAAHRLRHADLSSAHRAALAHLAPDVISASANSTLGAPSTDMRAQLFEAVLQAFGALARTQPLLLLLEDVHWAAESLLDWLTYITPRLGAQRMLVVSTYRTEEVGVEYALARLERRFGRDGAVVSLPLKPLTREGHRELILRLSKLKEAEVDPVADRLFAETSGNPFFLHEVVRGLTEAGAIEVSKGKWTGAFVEAASGAEIRLPDTLRATIMARVERLNAMARAFLRVAAVAGRVFEYAIVQHAGGWADELALDALEALLGRNLVRQSDSPQSFAFAHHLVQEVIYLDTTAPRRAYWHRRIAEALGSLRPDDYEALAYHLDRAGDESRAGGHYARAGEQAAALYANEEAVRYLERALQLITEPQRRLGVMRRLGDVWQLIGKRKEAEVIYRQAIELAEAVDDRRTQAQCKVALGRLTRLKGEYAEALMWLGQAQTEFQALEDRQGLAQALGGLGAVYWSRLDYAHALDCFQQQLALARELGDRRGAGMALGSLGVVYTEQGDYPRALSCYLERLNIDLALGDQLSLAKTIGNMGIVYGDQGDYVSALACYHRLLQVTLELGDRQNVCIAVGNMIDIYAAQGQYPLAERLSRQAIALGRTLNIPLYLCEYLHASANLYARQARYAEARRVNDEALSMATHIGQVDIQFPAKLLSLRLRVALHELDESAAIKEMEALLAEWSEDHQQAAIYYELWRLDSALEPQRRSAITLYERLYARTPNLTYRQRYQELTGQPLPDAPPLPKLPDSVTPATQTLDSLLAQVEEVIAGM